MSQNRERFPVVEWQKLLDGCTAVQASPIRRQKQVRDARTLETLGETSPRFLAVEARGLEVNYECGVMLL